MRFSRMLLITSQVIVASLVASSAALAQKQAINPPNARPGGVLSTAVRVGDVIYFSGALGTKPGGGGVADGGIQGQTR